jgi:hypothetical protein
VLGTLLAFSGNAVMKLVVSWVAGRAAFTLRLLPGQVIMVSLAWAGWAAWHWLLR